MKLEYKWTCPICNVVFKTKKLLYQHQQEFKHYIHVPAKESICQVCNEVFKSINSLKIHIKQEKHYKYKLNKNHIWICSICNENFETRKLLQKHRKENHINDKNLIIRTLADRSCQFCGYKTKYKCSLTLHEKYCKLNPNRIECERHPFSEEAKQKLSKIQKERAAKGLNHGWMACHSSKKSYPEEFFTKVIENEFNDKNYEYNLLFYQYRLDFAWPQKKLCIEIDGSQHQRDEKQKQSDIKKDIKLYENGWKVLRIKWVDMYHKPQEYIKQAKEFIDNGIIITCAPYINPGKIKKEKKSIIINHNWHCRYCNNEFNTRNLLSEHLKICKKRLEYKENKKQEYKKLKNKEYELNNIPKDKIGRFNPNILSEEIWEQRKNNIFNCGIDLQKFGWVEKVIEKTGYTKRIIENTIKRFQEDFEGKYFRKNRK